MALIRILLTLIMSNLVFSDASQNSTTSLTSDSHKNQSRKFSIFNVVQFDNLQCTVASSTSTNVMFGTCFARSECDRMGGVADGNCASGFGVCCMFTVSTCGSTISKNCTYIQNPGYPSSFNTAGGCTYNFQANSDICQIRLDFNNFMIVGPDTFGACPTDTLVVMTPPSSSSAFYAPYPHTNCGILTGSHMYLETARSDNPGTFTVNIGGAVAGVTRSWKVKVSYIECFNPNRAPTDCLQYYTATSGTFMSFNYQSGSGQMVQNQNYYACFRQNEGYCNMELSEGNVVSSATILSNVAPSSKGFVLSGKATVPLISKTGCPDAGLLIPTTSADPDYLQPVLGNPIQSQKETFCGSLLNRYSGQTTAGVIKATALPLDINVFSSGTPFTLVNTGFQLMYMQTTCQ